MSFNTDPAAAWLNPNPNPRPFILLTCRLPESLQDATSILTAVTVRRVGPPQETAPLHRTELGRVLVTIDDLAALMTLLTDDTPGLHIEFDGGYFTEAEELRTLSDIEVRSLRLRTPEVQVALNSSDAFAVGERQEAEDVYRLWARARKTQVEAAPNTVILPHCGFDAYGVDSTFAVMRRRGPRLAGLPGFLRLLLVGGMSGEIGLR